MAQLRADHRRPRKFYAHKRGEQRGQIVHIQRQIAVINNDEIIAAAAHFVKFNCFIFQYQ